jgi:hypothetical protein
MLADQPASERSVERGRPADRSMQAIQYGIAVVAAVAAVVLGVFR